MYYRESDAESKCKRWKIPKLPGWYQREEGTPGCTGSARMLLCAVATLSLYYRVAITTGVEEFPTHLQRKPRGKTWLFFCSYQLFI
jgi:hypothetical protein